MCVCMYVASYVVHFRHGHVVPGTPKKGSKQQPAPTKVPEIPHIPVVGIVFIYLCLSVCLLFVCLPHNICFQGGDPGLVSPPPTPSVSGTSVPPSGSTSASSFMGWTPLNPKDPDPPVTKATKRSSRIKAKKGTRIRSMIKPDDSGNSRTIDYYFCTIGRKNSSVHAKPFSFVDQLPETQQPPVKPQVSKKKAQKKVPPQQVDPFAQKGVFGVKPNKPDRQVSLLCG